MTSGIYSIIINQKIYIGSAVNLTKRKYQHKSQLNTKKHPNILLQRAFNKYQEFEFKIIELCEKEKLLDQEQFWIDFYKSVEFGYNIVPKAGSNLGRKMSEEAKLKMRKPRSEQARLNMSLARKGMKLSEDHKRNIGKGLLGKRKSTKTKEEVNKDQMKDYDYKRTPNKYFTLNGNEMKVMGNG